MKRNVIRSALVLAMCATLLTVGFAGTGAAQVDAGVNASVGNATGGSATSGDATSGAANATSGDATATVEQNNNDISFTNEQIGIAEASTDADGGDDGAAKSSWWGHHGDDGSSSGDADADVDQTQENTQDVSFIGNATAESGDATAASGDATSGNATGGDATSGGIDIGANVTFNELLV
ncbi:hypothetical protein [Haladaptatus sp. DYF46]|uniref:hypothetical protein n=1 Tax=Haladaptatus sp. DYF46 TaxID=2886041 RepID=UPI001E5DFDA7|nr:hypothetical protein [Haladaptatus sp. DYF46]